MKNTMAVILAAGKGTRMKSDIPKVLHRIGSKTMLDCVICSLKEAGFEEMICVIGHKADLVRKSAQNKDVKFIEQKEQLGSGDALKRALPFLKNGKDVLVTSADTPLIKSGTYRALVDTHSVKKSDCSVLTSEVSNPFSYGRVVKDSKENILRIVEENDASSDEKRINEINSGTYVFSAGIIEKYIEKIKLNLKKKEFYLTDIVELIAKDGHKVSSLVCGITEAMGINSRVDLAEANKEVNKNTLIKFMENGVTIVDTATTFIDEGVDIGKDTVIYPHTVIENGATIKSNCKIGPFARIRSGSVIGKNSEIGNFVEIVRTKIGENTRVKHHAYIGDAEVGENVNIGAGVITANYDGKKKNKTVIADNCFIGVGVSLIAPVKIGKGARIGAGSVVTKNKNVPAGQIFAGVPARRFPLSRE